VDDDLTGVGAAAPLEPSVPQPEANSLRTMTIIPNAGFTL
jgi:hypothetical protein